MDEIDAVELHADEAELERWLENQLSKKDESGSRVSRSLFFLLGSPEIRKRQRNLR
jgi:hypothetical protein